ncbi:hypothetical protein WEI85_10805 [Actinomycetes bacterium KLBMP 9797]
MNELGTPEIGGAEPADRATGRQHQGGRVAPGAVIGFPESVGMDIDVGQHALPGRPIEHAAGQQPSHDRVAPPERQKL